MKHYTTEVVLSMFCIEPHFFVNWQVLPATPMGKWHRGWPRIRWHDCISNLA